MVGVLVGDEDRVETGELLEPGRPAARIDEQALVGDLDEEAGVSQVCLLYTSDAADERSSVDLGGRRIIKKKRTRLKIWRHTYT